MASLMIAYITVGEQITAEQLIEKCIVMRISRHDHQHRQWEGVLRAGFVEVFEIDTKAPGFVLLWYHDQVG